MIILCCCLYRPTKKEVKIWENTISIFINYQTIMCEKCLQKYINHRVGIHFEKAKKGAKTEMWWDCEMGFMFDDDLIDWQTKELLMKMAVADLFRKAIKACKKVFWSDVEETFEEIMWWLIFLEQHDEKWSELLWLGRKKRSENDAQEKSDFIGWFIEHMRKIWLFTDKK